MFIQNFSGPQDYFIELKEPSNKLTVVLNSTSSFDPNDPKARGGSNVAKWIIKYLGHPAPTVVWRDLHGNDIPWSTTEDKTHKLVAIIDKISTTLKINSPKIGDSGYYTLFADNGRVQKEQKFQLLVRGIAHTFI